MRILNQLCLIDINRCPWAVVHDSPTCPVYMKTDARKDTSYKKHQLTNVTKDL